MRDPVDTDALRADSAALTKRAAYAMFDGDLDQQEQLQYAANRALLAANELDRLRTVIEKRTARHDRGRRASVRCVGWPALHLLEGGRAVMSGWREFYRVFRMSLRDPAATAVWVASVEEQNELLGDQLDEVEHDLRR
jgi:hypothetical protein